MPVPDLVKAVVPVVTVLEQLGVPYYIGGSVAGAVYGRARATIDVDLVADLALKHVSPLVAALKDEYYISAHAASEAIAHNSCFNAIHFATALKVDIFAVRNRPYDRQALARIRKDTIDIEAPDCEFMVASAEDLILSKLQWYRLGDEVAQRQWLDVVELLQIQGAALDSSYLQKWAADLGVLDLLEKAREQAY